MATTIERIQPWLYVFFFTSGASSLMYEIVWSRTLRLVFGSTTVAVTLVVALFLLGLGLGSLVIGRYADRVQGFIYLYSVLELGIAFLGWTSLPYFGWVTDASFSFLENLVAVSVFLVAATMLMGATLPVLIKGLTRASESLKDITGRLYSLNTFGAVVGVGAASFVLIELIGIRETVFVAVAISAAVGLASLVLAYKMSGSLPRRIARIAQTRFCLSLGHWRALVLFFISGAIALSYEILWFRFFQPFIGPTTYTFAYILVAFLWGLAAGGAWGTHFRRVDAWKRIAQFSMLASLAALVIVVLGQLTDIRSAFLLLLLPMQTFMIGIMFPLFFAVIKPRESSIGFWSSRLYAANILGSITGIAASGLWLLDVLGTVRSIFFISLLGLLFGLGLLVWQIGLRVLETWNAYGVVLALGVVALFVTPSAFMGQLTQFRAPVPIPAHAYQSEDREAQVIAFKKGEGNGLLIVNGIGTTHLTTDTKVLAHLPLLLHPDPERVLVIALGAGTTYRSALAHDVNVDVVDIVSSLPRVLDVFFDDGAALRNHSKGNIIIDDGRHYVRVTKNQYDVIVIDPPPPVETTAANLFYSADFYSELHDILAPRGMVVSWFYGGIGQAELAMLERTFAESFAHAERWSAYSGYGEYLVGSASVIDASRERIARRLGIDAVRSDLDEWVKAPVSADAIAGLRRENRGQMLLRLGTGAILTDDHPVIEYYLLRKRFGIDSF
ncbi:MAG: hypothetical protein AAB671_01095 [Patescibacteria group bacterium]